MKKKRNINVNPANLGCFVIFADQLEEVQYPLSWQIRPQFLYMGIEVTRRFLSANSLILIAVRKFFYVLYCGKLGNQTFLGT